mmetsp:Transcript_78381/g.141418  ORF Transcript_78381/g.141418 Transcript_78381/m.141418 type:complete len:248 (-) Transcript_78381:269-1012(-)
MALAMFHKPKHFCAKFCTKVGKGELYLYIPRRRISVPGQCPGRNKLVLDDSAFVALVRDHRHQTQELWEVYRVLGGIHRRERILQGFCLYRCNVQEVIQDLQNLRVRERAAAVFVGLHKLLTELRHLSQREASHLDHLRLLCPGILCPLVVEEADNPEHLLQTKATLFAVLLDDGPDAVAGAFGVSSSLEELVHESLEVVIGHHLACLCFQPKLRADLCGLLVSDARTLSKLRYLCFADVLQHAHDP